MITDWWLDRGNVDLMIEWMRIDGYEAWVLNEAQVRPWNFQREFDIARGHTMDEKAEEWG